MRSSANKCPPVIPAYYKSLTWPNQPCAGDGDDDGFDDGDEEEDEECDKRAEQDTVQP